MASKHVIPFHAIATLFRNDQRQLHRGENAYASGHVLSMTFQGDVDPWMIKGKVLPSMKRHSYSVEISYSLDQGVVDMTCSCPRGTVICHHIAALLLHAHYNISSTDVTCQWSAPSGSEQNSEDAQSLESLYPLKTQYSPTSGVLPEEKIAEFKKSLGQTNVVGFSWLLKPEVEEALCSLRPSIEDILFSAEYVRAPNKNEFFIEQAKLTVKDIIRVNQMTLGQQANENWLVTRKMRLTASRFGIVLAACRRRKYPPSLFKTLFEGYSLDRVKAVQWGKNNEETALQAFQAVTYLEVQKCGLWVDSCGFLGASPDGLIGDDATLEIKCPYKFRNSSMKEGVQDRKYFFHYGGDDGHEPLVNSDHPYYHQIQGQLYITGRDRCYFFAWTPIEQETLLIEKDPEWSPNMDVLKTFYLDKFIPAVLDLNLQG